MEQLIKPVEVIRKPRGWVVAQTFLGERCIDDELVTVKKGFIVAATQETVDKFWSDNSFEGLQRKVAYFDRQIEAIKNWKSNSNVADVEDDEDAAQAVTRLEKKKAAYVQAIENGGKFN